MIGTLQGGLTWASRPAPSDYSIVFPVYDGIFAPFGNCLNFGNQDSGFSDDDGFTIMASVKMPYGAPQLASIGSGGSVSLRLYPSGGGISFGIYDTVAGGTGVTALGFPDNTWFTIAGTYDGSVINNASQAANAFKLYINGVALSTTGVAPTGTPPSNGYVPIGLPFCVQLWSVGSNTAEIDWLYLWKRALTAGEVAAANGSPFWFV